MSKGFKTTLIATVVGGVAVWVITRALNRASETNNFQSNGKSYYA